MMGEVDIAVNINLIPTDIVFVPEISAEKRVTERYEGRRPLRRLPSNLNAWYDKESLNDIDLSPRKPSRSMSPSRVEGNPAASRCVAIEATRLDEPPRRPGRSWTNSFDVPMKITTQVGYGETRESLKTDHNKTLRITKNDLRPTNAPKSRDSCPIDRPQTSSKTATPFLSKKSTARASKSSDKEVRGDSKHSSTVPPKSSKLSGSMKRSGNGPTIPLRSVSTAYSCEHASDRSRSKCQRSTRRSMSTTLPQSDCQQRDRPRPYCPFPVINQQDCLASVARLQLVASQFHQNQSMKSVSTSATNDTTTTISNGQKYGIPWMEATARSGSALEITVAPF